MKHPTKAQVQTVIDNLVKAAEMAEGDCPIDMMEGEVKRIHPCGSPMCHGGWYALATLQGAGYVYYHDGATRMAEHLGFPDSLGLQRWAKQNPTIWGNENGCIMFSSNAAFLPNRVSSLHDIINHWRAVQSRLPE